MQSLNFHHSVDDYSRWNTSTSVFTIPSRIVANDKSAVVRDEFLQVIGPEKLVGIQILPRLQLRVQFKTTRARTECDINGVDFRGTHLTPDPAYETTTPVFVENAPFQFSNALFQEFLSSYGRVTQVKHLPVKGHPNIQSGTRMVTMIVRKAIPAFVIIAGYRCKVRYKDQPITCFGCGQTGHINAMCPNKRGGRSYANVTSRGQSGDRSASTSDTPIHPPPHNDVTPSSSVSSEALPPPLAEFSASGPSEQTPSAGLSKSAANSVASGGLTTKPGKSKSSTKKSVRTLPPLGPSAPVAVISELVNTARHMVRSVVDTPHGDLVVHTSGLTLPANSLTSVSTTLAAAANTPEAHAPSSVVTERPERTVLLSPSGHLNVLVDKADCVSLTDSLSSGCVALAAAVVNMAASVPLPSEGVLDLPPPVADSTLEQMAAKGQKRTRSRDSDDEETKRPLLESVVVDDLPDTTVHVSLNVDAVLPPVSFPNTALLPPVFVVAPPVLAFTSSVLSPGIEDFPSSPSIGEFSSSDEETGNPDSVLPTLSTSNPALPPVAVVVAPLLPASSPAVSSPGIEEFSSSPSIEEFSSSDVETGNQVATLPAASIADSALPPADLNAAPPVPASSVDVSSPNIEEFSSTPSIEEFSSSTEVMKRPVFALKEASPDIQNLPSSEEIPDVVSPTPPFVRRPPPFARLAPTPILSGSCGTVTSASDSDTSIERDVPGHEVWDDSGCSTPPQSGNEPSILEETPSFSTLSSRPVVDDESGEEGFFSPDEDSQSSSSSVSLRIVTESDPAVFSDSDEDSDELLEKLVALARPQGPELPVDKSAPSPSTV